MQYVGRFAPSPSGSLHFGSLVTAVGSYLQAKANQGKWLVRIEDIDPPREIVGAASNILRTLEAYGLHWDDKVLYQSSRLNAYQAQIDLWLQEKKAYYCQCTRQQIKKMGGIYTRRCRYQKLKPNNCSIRVCVEQPIYKFNDIKRGEVALDKQFSSEDFIIKRRDGLFAYNLAVVMDDIYQGVTQVVRGSDLLVPTGRQLVLYEKLGAPFVSYLHLPLALNGDGNKLSKQNHAPAVNNSYPSRVLGQVLSFLGHTPPTFLHHAPPQELLQWATRQWKIKQVPSKSKIICTFENDPL